MKNLYTLCAFLLISCTLCGRNGVIDYNKIQGFYEYLVIDHENGSVIDTLYATARIYPDDAKDTIRFRHNITGFLFGTKNKFLNLWDVVEINNKEKELLNTVYFTDVKDGDHWSLNEELGLRRGTRIVEYSCVSIDTNITFKSGITLKDIVLILKKDWIDVNGFWDATYYGYDQNHKVVYINEMLINPRDNSIVRKYNYLILKKFIYQNKWSNLDSCEWVGKNSIESIRLFHNNFNYLKDIPPPPPPPEMVE